MLLASGLGSGFAPFAPGTAGSLLALLLGAALMQGPAWLLPLAAAGASIGGWWAVRRARIEGDPGWVVIDEVAGQWIALLGLSMPGPWGLALAFLLFRLLDILKPGPIGWADRQGGAFGVMADDVLAGALAALLLAGARMAWPAAPL